MTNEFDRNFRFSEGVIGLTPTDVLAESPRRQFRRRVTVWFGRIPITEFIGDQEIADRHAAAMKQRFAGLRVTNEAWADEAVSNS